LINYTNFLKFQIIVLIRSNFVKVEDKINDKWYQISKHKVVMENQIGNDLNFMWLTTAVLVAFIALVPLIPMSALCINIISKTLLSFEDSSQ